MPDRDIGAPGLLQEVLLRCDGRRHRRRLPHFHDGRDDVPVGMPRRRGRRRSRVRPPTEVRLLRERLLRDERLVPSGPLLLLSAVHSDVGQSLVRVVPYQVAVASQSVLVKLSLVAKVLDEIIILLVPVPVGDLVVVVDHLERLHVIGFVGETQVGVAASEVEQLRLGLLLPDLALRPAHGPAGVLLAAVLDPLQLQIAVVSVESRPRCVRPRALLSRSLDLQALSADRLERFQRITPVPALLRLTVPAPRLEHVPYLASSSHGRGTGGHRAPSTENPTPHAIHRSLLLLLVQLQQFLLLLLQLLLLEPRLQREVITG